MGSNWLEMGVGSTLVGLTVVYLLCFPVFWASGNLCCCVGRVGGQQKGLDPLSVSKGGKSATERLLDELVS